MNYNELVAVYKKIESTPKRLEKTYYLSELLKKTENEDLEKVILLFQGKVFHPWDDRKIGVAARLVIKALNISTGIDQLEIEKEWKKTGDLGQTAENLVVKKKQVTLFQIHLTLDKVFDNIRKLAKLEGHGTVDQKVKLISEILTSAEPSEAKYVVRTILEDLRVGSGQGVLRDAIVLAYLMEQESGIKITFDMTSKDSKSYTVIDEEKRKKFIEEYNLEKQDPINIEQKLQELVQNAYDITSDFSKVALLSKKSLRDLESIKLVIFHPIKCMLAQKVTDISQGFEKVGAPCMLEFKYDGFRMQVHKKGDEIILFTRSLENVTLAFPDVIRYIKKCVKSDECILDCEAVGYNPKTFKYMPFQKISQRIKRKYDIEDMAEKFPVELNVFDILFNEGKSMINEPLAKRRELLDEVIWEREHNVVKSKNLITIDEKEANEFYQKSLNSGNEGIMLKKLDARYQPGSRVGTMIKLKPVMDSLDLAIVGAEWGEGKRSGWFTSFILACCDEDGNYLEIGRVGTGFKEQKIKEAEGESKVQPVDEGILFSELTELLKPLILSEKGKEVKVKPEIVLEIDYEEIQKSNTYSSGYALRFPRVKHLRLERSAEDVSTLDTIQELFDGQKKKHL